MPLKKCSVDGKSGFKWGESGHCYNSPDQKENKRKAILQGVSYEGSHKVNELLKKSKGAFIDMEGVNMAKDALRQLFPRGGADQFLHSIAKYFSSKSDTGKVPDESTNDGNLSGSDLPPRNNEKENKEREKANDLQNQQHSIMTAELDTPTKNPAFNIVTPPYNKEASPDNPPDQDDMNCEPPTRDDMSTSQEYSAQDSGDLGAPDVIYDDKRKEENSVEPLQTPDADNEQEDGIASKYEPAAEDYYKFKVGREGVAKVDDEDADSWREDVGGSNADAEDGDGPDPEKDIASLEEYISIAFISTNTRNHIPDEDYAGPHQTFPIRNQEDVRHAAMLLHHAHDPSTVKRNIVRIAKRKGLRLPVTWSHHDEACYTGM